MTEVSEFGPVASAIAAASGNQWQAMDAEQLASALELTMTASLSNTAFLTYRCGGDYAQACLEIRRARELPESVLLRRHVEAVRLVELGDLPSIAQQAAAIAILTFQIAVMQSMLERKRASLT